MLIDLNADLGEGAGHDAKLMGWITSANICCGAHAGGPEDMRTAVAAARRHSVAVGAHTGYADRARFGRAEIDLEPHEVKSLCFRQIAALFEAGAEVKYLKPHGALYHRAMQDEGTAWGVAQAAEAFGLPCVGLPGSRLAEICDEYIPEGFADRRYSPDGTLVPRNRADAVIESIPEALDQLEWLIRTQAVRTICVHGDNPAALALAPALKSHLLSLGHRLRAFA